MQNAAEVAHETVEVVACVSGEKVLSGVSKGAFGYSLRRQSVGEGGSLQQDMAAGGEVGGCEQLQHSRPPLLQEEGYRCRCSRGLSDALHLQGEPARTLS